MHKFVPYALKYEKFFQERVGKVLGVGVDNCVSRIVINGTIYLISFERAFVQQTTFTVFVSVGSVGKAPSFSRLLGGKPCLSVCIEEVH